MGRGGRFFESKVGGKGVGRATGDDPSHTHPDLRFYVSSGGLVHSVATNRFLLSLSLS